MVMEMTKTYQYRKVMKPLLERKRRARINKCLDDLRDLMVECLTQEGEHVTRLEKADILELTVEHMRKLKQRGNLALRSSTLNAHIESFRSGYVHAADQISQILLQNYIDDEIKAKLTKFISARIIDMQQNTLISNNSSSSISSSSTSSSYSPDLQKTFFDSIIFKQPTKALAFPQYSAVQSKTSPIMHNSSSTDDLKENDMIDIITVDNSNNFMDTNSVPSSDSNSSENVWRPWQKDAGEICKI